MMMIKYPSIETLFTRGSDGKVDMYAWRRPELKYLCNAEWTWEEKVNGRCIGATWYPSYAYLYLTGHEVLAPSPSTGMAVAFTSRSGTPDIPEVLVDRLTELFPVEVMKELYPDTPMCIYGEAYGIGMNKGSRNYIPDGVDFCCFDIATPKYDLSSLRYSINGGEVSDYWWLEAHNVEDICGRLGVQVVPVVGQGILHDAIDMARGEFTSQWGDFPAEGLVLRPQVQLLNRQGHVIKAKIKYSDFRRDDNDSQ